MKKTTILMTILCVSIMALQTGCVSRTPAEEPSPESSAVAQSSEAAVSSEESQKEVSPPPSAQLKVMGQVTVYRYDSASGLYEATRIPENTGELSLLDLVHEVGKTLGVELNPIEITQQKGMVVMNFPKEITEKYSQQELDPILQSIAMTLKENHQTFEWIQYQADGEVGVLGAQEFAIKPLKLVDENSDFAPIRAKVAYEGLKKPSLTNTFTELDKTGKELATFLSMVGYIDKNVSSPAELDPLQVLRSVIYATKSYSTEPSYDNYREELKPITAAISEKLQFVEDTVWIKEHIEETAKRLYGKDFVLSHQDVSKYKYFEQEGVYTPPHMGTGVDTIPIIFDYEDTGDGYRIDLTYIGEGMGGYFNFDPNAPEISPDENILKYAKEKGRHRMVRLAKTDDGGLRFVSHTFFE